MQIQRKHRNSKRLIWNIFFKKRKIWLGVWEWQVWFSYFCRKDYTYQGRAIPTWEFLYRYIFEEGASGINSTITRGRTGSLSQEEEKKWVINRKSQVVGEQKQIKTRKKKDWQKNLSNFLESFNLFDICLQDCWKCLYLSIATLGLKHMLIVRTESGSKLRRKIFSYLTHPDWDDIIWTLWLSLIQKRINKCEKVMATWGDALKFWTKGLNKYKRSCHRKVKPKLFDLQDKQSRPWGFSHLPLCIFEQIESFLLALTSLLSFVSLV